MIARLLASALLLFVPLAAHAASITYSDNIEVSGNIVTTGCIVWGDNSVQCNASGADVSAIWGNITGILADQSDLWKELQKKEEKLNKGAVNGYAPLDENGRIPSNYLPPSGFHNVTSAELTNLTFTPVWFTQGNIWQEFTIPFNLIFHKVSDTSNLRVSWSDNVGIFNPNWCNVGLFINDSVTPFCKGAWSGISQNTIFQTQSMSCVLPMIGSGQHTITVKHRSQYCMYGNYAWDDYGSSRTLTVEEF